MSAVQPFRFDGADVRVVTDDHGEPWFVAADVCSVLGIANARDAVARLDPDEKGVASTDTLGGTQQVTTISEPGLYALVGRSRKPEARSFDRWVRHEVLPAIRRTGSYEAPALTGPALMAAALIEAQATLAAKDEQLAIAAPKAEAFDAFLSATGDYSVNEAAKILSRDHAILTGEKRLWAWLDANGWTYRQAGERRAYQRRIEQGVLAEKAGIPWHHPRTGEVMAGTPQVRVTPKGIDALAKALTKVADQGELEVGA